ncbi:mRNA export factor GLE1 isoform X2 [Syngnathoides biaculeatus]|uniref:mRNA export factor GLE1 isoform X2 n=1 Tax=Syngnathoides biaculeatus TaxID=300417 RepID=UPI002ADE6802|nr:mRNA export factor GLE1 isoform X2 [Syngnathoides biaculeatus]
MTSESLRWETLQALKNSPKGKITFNPYWSSRGEDILSRYQDSFSLSPQSGVILQHLILQSPQKAVGLNSTSGQASPGLTSTSSTGSSCDITVKNSTVTVPLSKTEEEQTHDRNEQYPEKDVDEITSFFSPTISQLSPEAMAMAGQIAMFEEEQRKKAKMAFRVRQELQEKLVMVVASTESEQLKRFEELMELKQRQEYQSMRDMMDKETKESIGRQEKLKEEQRHRMKIQNLRLREVEQQRLREAELERQRLVEGEERLRNLNSIQEEILQLNQLLEPLTQTQTTVLSASLGTYSTRGNQLCSQVSEVVRKTAEGQYPSTEDMTVAERALHEMRTQIRLMQEEAAKAQEEEKKKEMAESRRKVEDLKKQQEAKMKAEQAAKERVHKEGLQNNAEDTTLKWYKELQVSLTQCAQSIEQLSLSKDFQTKKFKLELQKAATIPISQISSNSGSQLREIFEKLKKLLSGRVVVSAGKSISTSHHPQGLDFVFYKVAEKFVKQGEEEVASHHEAAFPIGVMASGIWQMHPRFGDLLLGHLHKKCPYAVPHYPRMKDGTPVDEYQRILGYRVDDSGVEGQDSFLKRMSGMIRLYAAIIQLKWPFDSKHGLPTHGLNHGWRWLAQMLNMEPISDITATLLFDFLEVCGHCLLKSYQGQFWKVLLLLKEQYLPRIEAVTSSGQMGSVSRLKLFLEKVLQEQQISPPKGELTSIFWRS